MRPTQKEWAALSKRQRNHYHKMNALVWLYYSMLRVINVGLVGGREVARMREAFERHCISKHTTGPAVRRFINHYFCTAR